MNTLRFCLQEEGTGDAAAVKGYSWALYDEADRICDRGHAMPDAWPSAQRVEGIVAAPLVRLARVALPKLPSSQLPTALLYALEDQLAGEPEVHHVAPGMRTPDGSTPVAIVSKAWFTESLKMLAESGISLSRLVPESCLPPRAANEWVWVDAPRGGFIVTDDGASFAVDRAATVLPTGLTLAFDARALQGREPVTIRCYAPAERHSAIAAAVSRFGAAVMEPAWDWRGTSSADMDAAINLLCGEFSARLEDSSAKRRRSFRPAMWIACAAIGIHVLSSVAAWSVLEWRSWRLHHEMRDSFSAAFPDAPLAGPVETEFARRYALARHARGELAPDDALPLLARAAPVLRQTGLTQWRTLAYAERFLTLEFPRLSASKAHELQSTLRAVGVNSIVADFDGGTRIRLGVSP